MLHTGLDIPAGFGEGNVMNGPPKRRKEGFIFHGHLSVGGWAWLATLAGGATQGLCCDPEVPRVDSNQLP